ncbi:MAG: tetratricopeptide repeat protein, partial [Methanothrix sp.]
KHFLDFRSDIKNGESFTRLKRDQAIILMAVFLLVAVTALALALYLRPEIKDNSLFVALSFVATVFPCLYLVWQIHKSNNLEPEQTIKAKGSHQSVVSPLQIPSPPQDFIGREDDVHKILASFDRGATIIGLRGLGGVGKTALALVLADRLKNRFPDGQLFLNMQGTSKSPLDPKDAMAHIIRSYRGADASLPEDLNGLCGLYHTTLSGKKALILLDNAASREQVEPLLPPPRCALLVTSRNKFVLPGLAENDLDVLPMEDAKELLLEISGHISGHAEELAHLCGCLPLALRNVASILREKPNLSIANYIKRLGDARKRLELAEASFSLSYDLLTPELQRLWSMLSVFPDDFDLAGAGAVWGMEETSAEDSLAELVKWSLVDFLPFATGKGGRYRLHEIARVFAALKADADICDLAQLHHSEHYNKVLALANEIIEQGNENFQAGFQLFDLEKLNIMAGQSWAERNLDANSSAIYLCKAYASSGVYFLKLGLLAELIRRWLETGLEAARHSEDIAMEGLLLSNLGTACFYLGETCKAIECYEKSLKISRIIGDKRGKGTQLYWLGNVYLQLGKSRKAIKSLEQALKIACDIEDRQGEGTRLACLGIAYLELGETHKAVKYCENALKIFRSIGDKPGELKTLVDLGYVYIQMGETRKAIKYLEQALKIASEIGDRQSEGDILCNLGNAFFHLSEIRILGSTFLYLSKTRRAIKYCLAGLKMLHEIGDKRGEASVLNNLGAFSCQMGKTHKAIEYYEQALTIICEIGDRGHEGRTLCNLGTSYFKLGEMRKTIECYEKALKISRETEDLRSEGVELFIMSLALYKLGQRKRAVDMAKSALAISEQVESPQAETVRQKLAEWSA